MEKEEWSSIAGGMTYRNNHYENYSGRYSENWKYFFLKTQKFHFWVYTEKMPQHTIRTHAPLFLRRIISNSQKLERTQKSLNGRINTENVAQVHNSITTQLLKLGYPSEPVSLGVSTLLKDRFSLGRIGMWSPEVQVQLPGTMETKMIWFMEALQSLGPLRMGQCVEGK